jgi:hypothetical protein
MDKFELNREGILGVIKENKDAWLKEMAEVDKKLAGRKYCDECGQRGWHKMSCNGKRAG